MNKDNLIKVAESFIDFLWVIQSNILKENDFVKNLNSLKNDDKKDCFYDLSLPPSHVRVIFYLLQSNSSPISQIADNLNISKSNMTPIIDNLIGYDLVSRYPDPHDRRILRVELTPKANDLLTALRNSICNSFAKKIKSLSDDEITTLDTSISNLIYILRKLK